jgi:transcriptional regulator with GAF, ATPase, and Fis domain
MQELFTILDRITASDSTVYIHGENGTGKELVAKEIHEHSRRADAPFIIQNCSALNDNLLESEMFGHKRGAFTGAIADKPGLFDLADGGTFFLDEVGEMSPALQVKLLRVLQDGTFLPVGGNVERKVDVRVLCATNRDLHQMVQERRFREDLYYRINVINVFVPPLRERRDDIPVLTEYFLARSAETRPGPGGLKSLSSGTLQRLTEFDWPGNVRELENEIERMVVLAGSLVSTINEEMLSPRLRHRPVTLPGKGADGLSLPETLEKLEREIIYEELRKNRWNKTRTAKALGISRRNLIRKVDRYGFDRRSR